MTRISFAWMDFMRRRPTMENNTALIERADKVVAALRAGFMVAQ